MKCSLKNAPPNKLISAIIIYNPKTNDSKNKNELTVVIIDALQPEAIKRMKNNLLNQGYKVHEFQGTVKSLRKTIKNLKGK